MQSFCPLKRRRARDVDSRLIVALVATAVARAIRRPGGFIACHGGEEFAVPLADTEKEEAVAVALTLRDLVHALAVEQHYRKAAEHITTSIGVTSVVADAAKGPETLGERAARAFHCAKHPGRNSYDVKRY